MVLSKIGYDEEKLKAYQHWREVQDSHFEHRHKLEVVRRCIELIRKYHEDKSNAKRSST
jgi:hypothetical protein